MIAVPEPEEGIGFEDDMDVENEVGQLQAIVDELGESALTESEYALLVFWNRNQVIGDPDDHNANLAEFIPESDLMRISQDVLEWVNIDDRSREPWQQKERRGIRALGVSPNTDGGADFEGASEVVHPALAEGCVRFAANALESLWPAGGPVKTVVLGDSNDERQAQAVRVQKFMNYQYSALMEDAFEQTDQKLIRLPLSGSVFVKVYPDPLGTVARKMVEPVDFLVPYKATSLEATPRYTERIMTFPNDLKKLQKSGFYRDIEIARPIESHEDERDTVMDEIAETEGRDEDTWHHDDDRHTLYEMYVDYDVPGFEDPDGIALPYIITVDNDSRKVLGIYRNWRKGDPLRKKIVYHTHYKFMPGLGFYGYGLFHWAGGLATATTGALRALLDAAQFSNMPGGFKTQEANVDGGERPLSPGEWRETEATAEDLAKAFFTIPWGEPSAVLFQLLPHLEELLRRFMGTTEADLGAGNTNVPVGTMLARIEQSGKVQTAIQKRLHKGQGREFKLTSWLNSQYLPQEYPYAVEGESRVIFRSDFDGAVDVLPVSDPNVVSNTQRLFVSQASIELAERAPHHYNMYQLHRRAQQALRIENLDEILPPPESLSRRMGPVEENAAVIKGVPLKAFKEQDHASHLMVHTQMLSMMDDDQRGRFGPALQAHIQEHMAFAYLLEMEMATGALFRSVGQDDLARDDWEEVPVEVENAVALASAQAAQQLMQAMAPPEQQDPALVEVEREQARKDQEAAADIQRKDSVAAADIQRKNVETMSDMERKATEVLVERQRPQTGIPA